jgi:hypothetical protein
VTNNPHTKLFLSHATPEDNYFAGWLTAKLALMGYDVWCELRELKGGEDFWRNIEQIVRQNSVKFLFVVSGASVQKHGVRQELALAEKIRDRGDFIIPLRIGDVAHGDLPIELIRLNVIDFTDNWAGGLGKLLEKLEKDQVLRTEAIDSAQILQSWKFALSINDNILKNRDETYRSNWFEYSLPKAIYLHKPSNLADVDVLRIAYPTIIEDGYLITFACPRCVATIDGPMSSEKIEITRFLENKDYVSNTLRLSVKEVKKKTIELLNQAFTSLLRSKGMLLYSLSQEDAYYFPRVESDKRQEKVSLKKYGRKWIQLVGDVRELNWHFAIHGNAAFYPVPAYSVMSHVIFTTQDGTPLDSRKQHRLRRGIGKHWHNKKWRDLLLGAMLWLSDDKTTEHIDVSVCCNQYLTISNKPIEFVSPQGYTEPT